MSDYTSTYTENTGDSIDTADFSTEFNAIETAIATKLDKSSLTNANLKVVNIGDWNMNSTGSINVAHGLTLTKIRSISCMIRNDLDAVYYNFPYADGDVINMNSINVNLNRVASGVFDSTSFDSTGYNRGWLSIWYTD